MDTALAYETDYEAMKAYFESREVDPTKPVSENAQTNEKTMEVWNYLRSVYGKQVINMPADDGQSNATRIWCSTMRLTTSPR